MQWAEKTTKLGDGIDVAAVINNDKRIHDLIKVVFIPNYSVSLAQIITPAADCMRWAHVREPTIKKKASCIFRCSQMMPVRPQNTSR